MNINVRLPKGEIMEVSYSDLQKLFHNGLIDILDEVDGAVNVQITEKGKQFANDLKNSLFTENNHN